jgi:hypothetical protein
VQVLGHDDSTVRKGLGLPGGDPLDGRTRELESAEEAEAIMPRDRSGSFHTRV